MSSNILREVLNMKPHYWDEDDYEHKIFVRRNLCPSQSEYGEVSSLFSATPEIKKIERVQNPFLFGKYIIRKEQLSKRGENVKEVKCYITVKIEDIDSALEYNCDPRFVNVRSMYASRGNPIFYMDPNSITCEGKVIIVLTALLTNNESSTFSKTTDTEYYPQYIVFF